MKKLFSLYLISWLSLSLIGQDTFSIILFNNLGQLLLIEEQSGIPQISITISHLQAGLYYLLAEDQKRQVYFSRFVKS